MDKDKYIEFLEERLNNLEEIASLGTWEMEVATGKSFWSDQFYRICGYEPGSIEPTAEVGFTIIHPADRKRAEEAVARALDKKPYAIEKRIVRPDGTIRHVESRGKVEFDSDGNPVKLTGTFLDITDRKEYELRLNELAIRDPLTGIFNRRFIIDKIEDERERSLRHDKRFSILMIDLDYFKDINDKYGHDAGDKVLCFFTKLVSKNIRKIDYLGRYGGEEFIILLPDTDIETARTAAEKIQSRLCESKYPEDIEVKKNLEVSIGVAEFDGEEEYVSVIDRADKALYKAKASGRNCVI
jgi:diguanylate cyclase (GGDEF)-like protein/PAS domain S-box-containing protein